MLSVLNQKKWKHKAVQDFWSSVYQSIRRLLASSDSDSESNELKMSIRR